LVRYRFSDFTLSPQRRLLVRDGREVPLIPRYFDLLLLLIERRREAVHRREIFDRVWADSVVSDSALSQAVRTIRRTLEDDPREPRFIRTVSRHGYQFVFPDVIEEAEENHASPNAAPIAHTVVTVADGHAIPPPIAATAPEVNRWAAAAAGAALAGIAAGGMGGLLLAMAPGSTAPVAIAPVLAVVGGGCGALGGAGVATGLAFADGITRVPRPLALTAMGAIGGGLVGLAVQWLTRWGLAALLGLDLAVGGALEGVVIGGAAGLGVAIAMRNTPEGLVARSSPPWFAALAIALVCGVAGLALTLAGRPLASGTINIIAHAAEGSRARLAPLGRLIGERDFGPVSSAILTFSEGALFGLGFGYGVIRRARDHEVR
jgi:DNA-binding winged helix-turn-helix (wHTH) protein